ncbi:MAG: hypothetical protein ACOCZS_00200 [Verrucomicrobiota bacterium]
MSYRYILRYTIDPEFNSEDRIEELAQFCLESRIEEVMFLFTAEELSLGHATREMCEPWIQTACRLRDRLAEDSIDISLNPWTTTYHLPRGRHLFPDQEFTTMVGANGNRSPISACPLCHNWRQYICDLFAEWCSRIKPTAIWIEDDWRLHNHGAELGFGGCFCELHLERFSNAVGQKVKREELLEKILASDEPHPWRKIWLDIWKDSLLEPARDLYTAVKDASPATRLALMSSDPDTHSIEGRDWHALQDALGFEPSFMSRPHLPPYTQDFALKTPPSVTRHTIANLKRPLEIYPELENSPRCGQYSKSRSYSMWECLHSVCYGADGITINAYDMMGNGISLDPGLSSYLAAEKDRLSALKALDLDDDNAEGVNVLFHPETAARRHCPEPRKSQATFNPAATGSSGVSGMALLKENSAVWSKVFFNFGIAHRLTHVIPRDYSPVAVNGQTLRCFNDDEIDSLLHGPLLLDGLAAEVLFERGFGEMAGIKRGNWLDVENSAFAYEQINEGGEDIYGLSKPRMTANRCSAQLYAIEPMEGTEIYSEFRGADHHFICPGLVVYRNPAGGTIASWSYPLDGRDEFFMAFFNKFRRILLQRLFIKISRANAPLAFADCDATHLYRTTVKGGIFLAWLNPTNDFERGIELILRVVKHVANVKVLDREGNWKMVAFKIKKTDTELALTLDLTVSPLNAQYLFISTS